MADISSDIIALAARGDTDAFEKIYRDLSGYVYRVALRMVDNPLDAEEVVQDVFVRVFDQLKYFRFEASLKTWTYRITVNTALNFRKKRTRHKVNAMEYQENTQLETKLVKPNFAEKEDHQNVIERLLGALNPDQRVCVILRNIESLSYEEIAQALDININTVRTRLKRAREKMLSLKEEVMNYDL